MWGGGGGDKYSFILFLVSWATKLCDLYLFLTQPEHTLCSSIYDSACGPASTYKPRSAKKFRIWAISKFGNPYIMIRCPRFPFFSLVQQYDLLFGFYKIQKKKFTVLIWSDKFVVLTKINQTYLNFALDSNALLDTVKTDKNLS